MKRLISVLGIILSLFVAGYSQTPLPTVTPVRPEQDNDIVKISTNLIQIDVTVTDAKGKIVNDLKPGDFEIYENDGRQEITNFSFVSTQAAKLPNSGGKISPSKNTGAVLPPAVVKQGKVGRIFAMVVDDLTLSVDSVHSVQRALKRFVDEQMQDGDLVAIIRTGSGIGALQQFTFDRRQLYAAIEKIKWNAAGSGTLYAFDPIKSPPGAIPPIVEEQRRMINIVRAGGIADRTLSSLDYIIQGMKRLPGRKSLMFFSDGFLLGDAQSQVIEHLRRLTDSANRAAVVIYTADARGNQYTDLNALDETAQDSFLGVMQKLDVRKGDFTAKQKSLVYLADETGGKSLINSDNFNQNIGEMLNDQEGYYLIGYVPDSETFNPKTQRFNKLNVKVNRPGLTVRYRSGFFNSTETPATNSPVIKTPAQKIGEALVTPFATNDINLRLNTLFARDDKTGNYIRSLLHIDAQDIQFSRESDKNGNRSATFDIVAASFGDNGIVVDKLSKNYTVSLGEDAYQKALREGLIYNFIFPVKKPGAYQLRVVLYDPSTEKLGSANQFIEVPDLKDSGLVMSGAFLRNMPPDQYLKWQKASTGVETEASLDELARDTSLRQFKSGSVLHYSYEVYNAKARDGQAPKLTSQTMLFLDGKPVFTGKATLVELGKQENWRKITLGGALNLGAKLAPGDYVLQIVLIDTLAKKENQIASQFIQFQIVD